MPLSVAAQLLGTSEAIALELIDSGLLEAEHTTDEERVYRWYLTLEVIENFIAKIRDNMAKSYGAKRPFQPYNLITAAKLLSEHNIGVSLILKLMLAGELRGFWLKGETELDELRFYSLILICW